jgi:hypothetical protein
MRRPELSKRAAFIPRPLRSWATTLAVLVAGGQTSTFDAASRAMTTSAAVGENLAVA